MPVICGGLIACSNQEVNFNFIGLVCVLGATVLRAVKSVMQEQLLDPKARALDSVSLVYFLAPWTGGILIVLSMIFEGSETLTILLPPAQGEKTGIPTVLLLLLVAGANACFLNISGNQVTAYMGAVMLQILGNVKACLSIVVSCMIFKNPVTNSQALGVVVCLLGVGLYNMKGGVVKASVAPVLAAENKGSSTPNAPQ
jgi:drug/metabolite transporter (DMT)-like permease